MAVSFFKSQHHKDITKEQYVDILRLPDVEERMLVAAADVSDKAAW